jgi:hypothetical protein
LKRIAISFLVVLGVMAVPAVAGAKTFHASVLRVDRQHHKVRVVTPNHAVRSYRYAGKVGRKVKAGARIVADLRGGKLRHVRAVGRTRVLRFYGRVVSDGRKGLVLKLGDGKRITLGSNGKGHARVHAASANHPISISIEGLQPGQTVLVTITFDSTGGQSITIQITSSSSGSGDGSGNVVDNGDGGTIDDNNGDDYTVDGTVTAVDPSAGTLEIDSADGHLVFTADPSTLDGIAVGDNVEVDYAKDTSNGTLIADDVFPVDPSSGSGDGSGTGSGDTGSGSGDTPGSGSGDTPGSGSGDTPGSGSGDTPGSGSGAPSGGLHSR